MKTLSKLSQLLNLGCLYFIVYSMIIGGWYLFIIPALIGVMILNIKFYDYQHKEEYAEYDRWEAEFSKTHEYLGMEPIYQVSDFWKNKATGEIIEI